MFPLSLKPPASSPGAAGEDVCLDASRKKAGAAVIGIVAETGVWTTEAWGVAWAEAGLTTAAGVGIEAGFFSDSGNGSNSPLILAPK